MRCFKHAENNVHMRRAGYSEHARHIPDSMHVRRTCIRNTAYMYHSANAVLSYQAAIFTSHRPKKLGAFQSRLLFLELLMFVKIVLQYCYRRWSSYN